MAGSPPQLPAFVKLHYDGNGALSQFKNDIEAATGDAGRRFQASFDQIGKTVGDALRNASSAAGRLDLGTRNFQQAAAEARLYKEAINATLRSAQALAVQTGDNSTATRSYIQALEAQNVEARMAVSVADAQVASYTRLQAALDATAASNSRLAQAQREVYAEQARAAMEQRRLEQRNAAFTNFVSPAIGTSATSNGAGYSALAAMKPVADMASGVDRLAQGAASIDRAAMSATNLDQVLGRITTRADGAASAMDRVRQAAQSAAIQQAKVANLPGVDSRSGVDRLIDGAGSIDRAAMSATTLDQVLGRVANRADGAAASIDRIRQVAQAAAAEQAKADAEAARAAQIKEQQQKQLLQVANALRAELDPMFAAQQRFDAELARADKLYDAAAISAKEYAQAQQLARDNLRQSAQAIMQNNVALERQAKTGTTASQAVTNSARSQRFAFIQLGQQMQDVAIQAQMGTNPFTILVQQGSQAAFALSGLGGTVGRVAAFLSGPFGAGIFLATAALGTLITSLLSSEDAALDVAKALDMQKLGTDGLREAIKALNEIQEKQNTTAEETARITRKNAEEAYRLAEANVARAKSELAISQNQGVIAARGEGAGIAYERAANQAAEAKAILADAEKALTGFRIIDAKDNARANTDERFGIERKYSRAEGILENRFKRGEFGTGAQGEANLQKAIENLNKARERELKLLKESEKATRVKVERLPQVTGTEVASLIGAPIINGKRTAAQNKAVGGAPNSYHLTGNAIDIPLTVGGKPITKEGIRAALEPAGVIIKELLGPGDKGHNDHFHIAFDKKRGTPDKMADAQRRAAEDAARETERLSRVSDQAAESILRINEQFDDQPRLVDRSAQAVRKLQGIIDELSNPANAGTPRRAELIGDAKAAQVVAGKAVETEIGRYAEANERNLEILNLQAKGLAEQAAILSEINQLDERLGLKEASKELIQQRADIESILTDTTLTTQEREAATAALARTTSELETNLKLQGKLTDEARNRVIAERELQKQAARTGALLEAELNVMNTARSSLQNILSGRKTDILGDMKRAISDLRGARLFDSMFGDIFDQIETELRKQTPLGKATDRTVKSFDEAGNSAKNLADALEGAAAKISGTMSGGQVSAAALAGTSSLSRAAGTVAGWFPGAANDNIVVNGKKPVAIEQTSIADLSDKMAEAMLRPWLEGMEQILGTRFMQGLSGVMKGAMSGYMQAGPVGGVIGGLKGIVDGVFKGAGGPLSQGLGTMMGGAGKGYQTAQMLESIGIDVSKTGSAIGASIGSLLPIPGGDIIGAIAGGIIGKVVSSTPRGSAIIGANDGKLGITGTYGNSAKRIKAAEGFAGETIDSIDRIAQALGASVDASAGKVSIGIRKGNYKVDPQGRGYTKSSKYSDIMDFGEDQAAAIKAATLNLIQDGVLVGLRDSTKRLLSAGDDLEAALQDALDFEGVFQRLKTYKDPVGSALDTLDKEFTRLIGLFKDAGASTEEYAQLEELYGIERSNAVKEAGERITSSLKSLFDDLTIGDNGLSLRTRETNALAKYDPLAARVAAGDKTAYDEYAQAARDLLDIQRQIYGSGEKYFESLDEVTALTKVRIDAETNIASIAQNRESPFDSTGQVKTAVEEQTDKLSGLLEAINTNIITLANISGGTTTVPSFRTMLAQQVGNF